MRIALPLLVLLTTACSTTVCRRCCDRDAQIAHVLVDMDGDGLADARHPDGALTAFGSVHFVDTDEDGLPDSRIHKVIEFVDTDEDGLPDSRRVEARGESDHETRVERALQDLERAIAEVRRAMR